jgi:hypothetical protein
MGKDYLENSVMSTEISRYGTFIQSPRLVKSVDATPALRHQKKGAAGLPFFDELFKFQVLF